MAQITKTTKSFIHELACTVDPAGLEEWYSRNYSYERDNQPEGDEDNWSNYAFQSNWDIYQRTNNIDALERHIDELHQWWINIEAFDALVEGRQRLITQEEANELASASFDSYFRSKVLQTLPVPQRSPARRMAA